MQGNKVTAQRFALPAGGRSWTRLIIQKNAWVQNPLLLAVRIPPVVCTLCWVAVINLEEPQRLLLHNFRTVSSMYYLLSDQKIESQCTLAR